MKPTVEQLAEQRLQEIRDLAEGGYSELTGKIKRDPDSGEIIGRYGGLNIPELLAAGTTPKPAAAAIRKGRGVLYDRIRAAAMASAERQLEWDELAADIDAAAARGEFDGVPNVGLVKPAAGRPDHKHRKGSEALEYQLAYAIDRRMHPNIAAAKRRARLHFLETGRNIPGVRIIAKWRNPDNRNPLHANWKTTEDPQQSLFDFWQTLHGQRGALRGLDAIDDRETVHVETRKVKAKAMALYHQRVRSLRKPGWSYKRARAAYRRKYGKKGKRK